MKYTAWMWKSLGAERRETECESLTLAMRALTMWLEDWPDAVEYGIYHGTPEGPVEDFLSAGIKDRLARWERSFDPAPRRAKKGAK